MSNHEPDSRRHPEQPGDDVPQDTLEALITECISRYEECGAAGVEELCAAHPQWSGALRARMRGLAESGLLDPWSADLPERLGEFELLQPLGGGGMGVVYLARQTSLAREVALKLIRPDQLYFPGARERFQREVELVAQLQHPAIVPVYTVGEEKGIPYFAMERVRGCTLGEVVDELRGGDAETLRGEDLARAVGAHLQRTMGEVTVERDAPLFDRSWPGACAQIIGTLARALSHAHEQGILHRDLKPSNAMITRSGRVQLFDFGLSTSQETGKLTRTGSLLGSVPYMAPEQINGEALDERTDIYALGVTLYELLTLTQPFAGKGALAMRDAINAGNAESPRRRNTRIPRDLETVCMKAMAAVPAARYASALQFAEDLERFLARKPVRARRVGPLAIAWRWSATHKWQTAAALLGLLLIVGGPTTLATQRSRANRRLTAEFERAEAERARAESNLDRAVAAVQSMLVEVGAEELENLPGMGPVRVRLLERALELYQGILAQRPADPALQRKHAKLLCDASEVLGLLGRSDEAADCAREAIEILTPLADSTGSWLVRWDLGVAYGALARVYDREWNVVDAERNARLALDALERALAESEGADVGRRQRLAASTSLSKHNLALSLGAVDRKEEALALVQAAIRDAERAVRMQTDNAFAHYTLASALGTPATLGATSDEVLSGTAQAIEQMQTALALNPDPAWKIGLARLHQSHGIAAGALQDIATARDSFASAYSLLLELREAHPYDEDIPLVLTENRYNLAKLVPLAERIPLLEESVNAILPLAEKHPERMELRFRAVAARTNHLANTIDAGQLERAAELAPDVVAYSERFHADFPEVEPWQSVLVHIQSAMLDARRGVRPDLARVEALVRERAPRKERALRGVALTCALWCQSLDADGGQEQERTAVATHSMDLLEECIELGFSRMPDLAQEELWSALHDHPRFRALLPDDANR